MGVYRFILLILFGSLAACTTHLKSEPWVQNILNTDFTIKQDSLVISINCTVFDKLSPTLGIQTVSNYENSGIWTRAGCQPKVVSNLKAGSKVNISSISIRSDASGQCWQVLANDQFGNEFFIPSCKFFHTDLWVSPESPSEKNKLPFGFKSIYLSME